ncbi:MAG: DUF4197 domain-containing protein [Bacteroidia bacterium]|nr:DUF4197 domain-containing protein [Bacteroidia bacterium]
MKKLSLFIIAICVVSFSAFSQGGWGDKLKDVTGKVAGGGKGTGLTNDEIISGLKEALSVGAKNGASLASKADGFYKNQLIFIPFPPEAIKVKNAAEKVGMSAKIEEFVMTLNRAAEEAAKEAANVFINAVKNMSVSDGLKILKGSDNAATEYLKSATSNELRQKFLPIVKSATQKVQVTKYWEPLINNYNKASLLTGGEKINPDLDAYITDKAIDGLFKLIAQEEAKIRKDPIARVSDILKKVFAN